MSLKAYQSTQAVTESPRETEYRLFGQVTASLLDAQKPDASLEAIAKAVDWNRRLWNTLASDCAVESNELTKELRASIISLSIWVTKYSSTVVQKKAPLEPLIDINRTIMQGLAPASAQR